MKIRLLVLATLLVGLSSSPGQKKPNPIFAPIEDDPKLPRVLLVGDSISIGYTLPVRERLAFDSRLDGVRRGVRDLLRLMHTETGWARGALTADGIELVRLLKDWREPDVSERLARPAWYANPASSDTVLEHVEDILRHALEEAAENAGAVFVEGDGALFLDM